MFFLKEDMLWGLFKQDHFVGLTDFTKPAWVLRMMAMGGSMLMMGAGGRARRCEGGRWGTLEIWGLGGSTFSWAESLRPTSLHAP